MMINLMVAAIGVIIGLVMGRFFEKKKVHGPDSNLVRQEIHYDSKNGKWYLFEPKLTFCPII